MKIALIHGQNHKGSTYRIARMLADKLGGEVTEFFLPRDFGEFCVGCCSCFSKSQAQCPHYAKLAPITAAMDAADVIILASPVYVFHATGAMKAFLDHYGCRWMVHSPEERMFKRQGVCICTAAGGGMRSTLKDMADSLFFWGVARIWKYGPGLGAVTWDTVSDAKKRAADAATTRLAGRIASRVGRVKPCLRTKALFYAMRLFHKKGIVPRDVAYWREKGWTGKQRPWK